MGWWLGDDNSKEELWYGERDDDDDGDGDDGDDGEEALYYGEKDDDDDGGDDDDDDGDGVGDDDGEEELYHGEKDETAVDSAQQLSHNAAVVGKKCLPGNSFCKYTNSQNTAGNILTNTKVHK